MTVVLGRACHKQAQPLGDPLSWYLGVENPIIQDVNVKTIMKTGTGPLRRGIRQFGRKPDPSKVWLDNSGPACLQIESLENYFSNPLWSPAPSSTCTRGSTPKLAGGAAGPRNLASPMEQGRSRCLAQPCSLSMYRSYWRGSRYSGWAATWTSPSWGLWHGQMTSFSVPESRSHIDIARCGLRLLAGGWTRVLKRSQSCQVKEQGNIICDAPPHQAAEAGSLGPEWSGPSLSQARNTPGTGQ